MKKLVPLLFMMLLAVIFSCEKNDNIVQVKFKKLSLDQLESLVTIENVNYDSVLIRNCDAACLQEPSISEIQIAPGNSAPGQFSAADVITPVYSEEDGRYSIQFQSKLKIEDSTSTYQDVTIRFIFADESFEDVLIRHQTYKFPYETTGIAIDLEPFTLATNRKIQDFDIVDDLLYFNVLGAGYLYEFEIHSGNYRELFFSGTVDFVAVDSSFLFYSGEWFIERYHLESETQDLTFDLSGFDYTTINGIATDDGVLYVIFENEDESIVLRRFDYSGNLLSTADFGRKTLSATILDNILYTLSFEEEQGICRFDLTSGTFLETRPFPCESIDMGINGDDNKFYYYDYNRNLIASVDLSEFD